MNMEIQELHTKAMDLADQADTLKRQGKDEEANSLYRQSLEAESDAAHAARRLQIGEPTESVLFRSAASLAFCTKDYREAERLICMGLSGNPPADIADELRSLYDRVNMEKNLERLSLGASEGEHENVTITIPVRERNLLKVLVKKFGWACMF